MNYKMDIIEFNRLVRGQQEWGKIFIENRKKYLLDKNRLEKKRWKENKIYLGKIII